LLVRVPRVSPVRWTELGAVVCIAREGASRVGWGFKSKNLEHK
jgi:hypothetical protein